MSKPKLMISLLVAVSIIFFARPLFSEESFEVRYTAEFSQGDLSFDKLKGYDVITLKDGDWFAELGKPMLPSKELKIALPAGMAVQSVYVVNTVSQRLPGEYNIFPAQPPMKIGLLDRDVDFVEPDENTYTSSEPYPSKLVEFVHQSDLAGQGIAILQLYPLQYIPSEKSLTLYTSVTIVIEGVGGYECSHYLSPNISERGRRTYEQMVKDMVQNPEDVQLNAAFMMSTSLVPPGGPFDHVIITSTTYESYLQPLVDWHNQKGTRDTVITTSWIYSNYSGTSDQQKIRNFIIDANSSWGTMYFLLGGENGTVPFEYRTYYDENTPSDQYYSDYNGNWIHEVFVGRVTIQSSTEANTFMDKVLKYEKDPPRTGYPSDVLLIGMDLEPSTHMEFLKEAIDNSIPSHFNVTKVYDSHGGNHRTAVLNALNAGQNLVNHADHGWIDYMGTGDYWHGLGIYSSNVDGLVNDNQLSVVVSLACDPNRMDANDCIAEHFVIYNPYQAGVSFTGNTRSGWGYIGNPYALSGKLDWEWWKAVFERGKHDLGQALIDSKHNFPISNPDINLKRHCEWTFNLLGEPEMPIWTDEPDSFTVTHPLSVGGGSFLVHVEDSTTHFPVESAYVCLWKENDVYLTGYTDAGGDITFNPAPSTQGSMYVTVTKHNYIPYQDQVDITYIRGDANADGV
ncbi:MAG: C25 family cysteine peptidase, partial [Fidelibacterota bacterium]